MTGKRERHFEAQRLLSEITYELETKPLSRERREALELHAANLAGILSCSWLPITWPQRLLATGAILLGVQQAYVDNYEPMVWWSLLPFFSPRIRGEVALIWSMLRNWVRPHRPERFGVAHMDTGGNYDGEKLEEKPAMKQSSAAVERLGHILGWTCNGIAACLMAIAVYLQFTLEPRLPFPFYQYAWRGEYVQTTVLLMIPTVMAVLIFLLGRALRYILAGPAKT
jgi:hypothetical protein